MLWLPDVPRMLPETLEKIYSLIQQGAVVVGEAPADLATLSGGKAAKLRFNTLVKNIWGTPQKGIRKNGKGYIISGITLEQALTLLKIKPDVAGGDALWLHRRAKGADWYFVSAPRGKGFSGELSFRTNGVPGLWDPVTGSITAVENHRSGDRTFVKIDLVKSNACFIVFRKKAAADLLPIITRDITFIQIPGPWKLSFPAGWGNPDSVNIADLKPWKYLDLSAEGKAFSGTATYTTTFDIGNTTEGMEYTLDLGSVDMVASVAVNGEQAGALLAPPYRISLKGLVKQGRNTLSVQVTSTWFNRLAFDAGQPEEKRKTWTISGPDKNAPLRISGLMGPVTIREKKIK